MVLIDWDLANCFRPWTAIDDGLKVLVTYTTFDNMK